MSLGLGIDTSFDDTAVALVEDGKNILSNLCVSQFDEHSEFGGVIPERASRLHIEAIYPLLEKALADTGRKTADLDFVAVTNRPGLIGSLLVGVTTAKALAMSLGIPLVGINHLESHVYAAMMDHSALAYPYVSLLISGANTLIFHHEDHARFRVLGGTQDDAVGECLDKTGRFLGLGLPAGPALERLALAGDARVHALPRPMLRSGDYNFSFSGLKTAVTYLMRDKPESKIEDVAASILESVAEVCVSKTFRAAEEVGVGAVVLCGGAAANKQIREAFDAEGKRRGKAVYYPRKALCTDNAAMVAGLGYEYFKRGVFADLSLAVKANISWKSAAGA